MSDFFNEAYRRARSRFTPEQWVALTPQQVTRAIYEAMRELDAASIGPAPARGRDRSGRPPRKDDRVE